MFSPTSLIFLTVFIDLIGFGIVLPLLPGYAASLGVSDTAIGALVASFSLMQFLLAHWWGRLSDRIGRRPVLLVGLAGSAVSYLLFAVAQDFWLLLVSRLVAGGMGATVNVAQAYLADVTPASDRARAMGLIGAAFGLGFVAGPALGGITSRLGEAAPGLTASLLAALNLLLAWRWLPEPAGVGTAPAPDVPVHWSRFLAALGAVGFSTVGFTVLYVVFPLQAERALGFDRHETAYLFVLIGLVNAAIQAGLIGRLVARFGERPLMVCGAALLAVGLGMLPRAFEGGGRLSVLFAGLVVLSVGSAMIGPSAAAYVSRVAPAAEQGRALGILQSVGAMARIGGPIMAGFVAGHAGARMAFLVAGAAAGLAGVSALVAGRGE
jgi:MFS family permease